MSTVLRSVRPTARKEHRCEWCFTTITPGQKYARQTCVFDDRLYDWVGCLDCTALSNTVSDYWGHPEEGINETSFHDWATEHPEDDRALAWLARYVLATSPSPAPAPNADETGASA